MVVTEEDVEQTVDLLNELTFYLKIDDANKYKIRAYSGAADAVEGIDPHRLSHPENIDGIGDSIGSVIREFLFEGETTKLDDLKDRHADLTEMTEVEGIGPKTARRFYEELGITSLEELEEAGQAGRLQSVRRIGAKTEQNILQEIKNVRLGVQERKDWNYVNEYYEGLASRLRVQQRRGNIGRFEPAGSFRRDRETVGDLDVIIEFGDLDAEEVWDKIERWGPCDDVIMRGDTKMTIHAADVQIDFRIIETKHYAACLQYFTGSTDFNVKLRDWTKRFDLQLSEYGIENTETGEMYHFETEEDLFSFLGVPLVEPPERQPENLDLPSEPEMNEENLLTASP